jgi:general secretion pathway protein D
MGSHVTLNLLVDNAADLFSAPLRVTFDPKLLNLVDARRGALLTTDGQDIIFSRNVQNDSGQATINLSRFPGAGGVSGSGVLLTLEFQPVAPGASTVAITDVNARNARLETLPLAGVQAQVAIK